MKYMLIGMVALLLSVLIVNCAPKSAPSVPVAAPTISPQQSSPSGGKADWETQWEKTMLAAKKEGELLVYASNITSEARIALTDAMGKKFGIKMNFIVAPTPDLITRLNSEYRAGVYQVDVYLGGVDAVTGQTKPLGFLSPLEPVFILPEVKDARSWLNGKLPFFDHDGMVLAWLSSVSPGIAYNVNLVKEDEIASYLDLLKPEWKEKVVMSDPTVAGAGQSNMTLLGLVWGLDKAKEYLRSVLKQQNFVVTRDQRQGAEWVARGKYPVVLWPQTPIAEFVKAGAPLASPPIKEGKRVTASNGGLALPAKPPHSNAAVIFVNWLLSREGQTVASRTYGAPSTRIDIPTEGIPEMFIIKPGQKTVLQSEELNSMQYQWLEEWKRIMAE